MQKMIVLVLLVSVFFQGTVVQASGATVLLEAKVAALTDYLKKLQMVWNPATQTPVPNEEMKAAIVDGVAWLVTAQEEDGHFAYEYLPYEDRYREDDNIVRQAGALYALGEVVRRSETENKDTNRAIEKAIEYFESLSPLHEYADEEMRCVTKSEKSKLCKLGATSLALIGILGYVERYPDKANEYDDLIEDYTAFILNAKKDTSGFKEQYIVGSGFRSDTESSFSNGEALLALVRYYQYNRDINVKKVIDHTYEYLESQAFDSNLYLWMMAALKDMQALWPNAGYTTYAKNFTFWRMNNIQAFHNATHNYCPANEGFASAYSLLDKTLSQNEQLQLRREIDFWNMRNLGLQIGQDEIVRVGFDEGKIVLKDIKNLEQSKGGFLTSDAVPTQRIDFTQHCITAYVQTLVDIDTQKL